MTDPDRVKLQVAAVIGAVLGIVTYYVVGSRWLAVLLCALIGAVHGPVTCYVVGGGWIGVRSSSAGRSINFGFSVSECLPLVGFPPPWSVEELIENSTLWSDGKWRKPPRPKCRDDRRSQLLPGLLNEGIRDGRQRQHNRKRQCHARKIGPGTDRWLKRLPDPGIDIMPCELDDREGVQQIDAETALAKPLHYGMRKPS